MTGGETAISGSAIGLEYLGGSFWSVTSTLGLPLPQQILQISPVDGSATVVGTLNEDRLSEGGLADDDASGRLLGVLLRETSTNSTSSSSPLIADQWPRRRFGGSHPIIPTLSRAMLAALPQR